MKKILFLAILSSFVLGADMSGWNNSEAEAEAKAQKAEQARMCEVYTEKIKKYKETMRDDELAQATLNNYIRLQTKYCATSENNESKT